MSALRSVPGAHRGLAWRDWILGYAAAWLAPAGIGLAVAGLYGLVAAVAPAEGWAQARFATYMVATALILSPAFSWIGLLLSLPVVIALIAAGRFGWLSALVCGLLAGQGAAAILGGLGSVVAAAFGIIAALALWTALRLRRPDLF